MSPYRQILAFDCIARLPVRQEPAAPQEPPQKQGPDAYLERKSYLEQRALAARPAAQAEQPKEPEKQSAGNYRTREQKQEDARRRQQLRTLENELAALEVRIGELEQSLNDPEIYAQYEKMQEITDELNGARERYDQLFDEWSALAE